jgi:F0F1-type ATP synthase alpha subunit
MVKASLKQLSDLQHAYACSRTKMPTDYVVRTKYNDTTANGLTKCVTDYINFSGGQAERISNTGRYIDESRIVTDVLGNRKKIGSGKYIKGTGTNGTADISATFKGKSIKIEIKMKDKQSEAQKEYQQAIERAGGIYFICHNFDEFLEKFNTFANQ